ncbi:MAG: CDP-alcohol phosphatidyltransferase family protein [Methanotrichaceae archaeon]
MLKSRLVDGTKIDEKLAIFVRLGLHPNTLSMMALALAFGGFFSLWAHKLLLGLFFFILSGFMDMVDGAVARATGQVSVVGAFLDGVLDRYVELLLILGLMAYLGQDAKFIVPISFWIVLLIFGALMTTFVRAYADHRGIVKDQQILAKNLGGLLERAERLILLYIGMIGGLFSESWLVCAIVLAAILSNLTAVQRIFLAIKYGKRN